MPSFVAEFADSLQDVPDTPASRPNGPYGLARGQLRDRARRGASHFWAPTGPARRPAQDPPGLVPSERGPGVPPGSPDIDTEHPRPRRLHARESGVSPLLDRRRAPRVLRPAVTHFSASVLRARVPALLERMGLADRAHEPIARFSKGMVQRLALAQALLAEPDLLVLDEPMEGLDLEAAAPAPGDRRQSSGTRESRAPRFARPGRGGAGLRPAGRAGRGTARLSRFPRSLLRDPDTGGERSSRSGLGHSLSILTGACHERSRRTSPVSKH